jgi:Carboxypeptidase regulatory-like domain
MQKRLTIRCAAAGLLVLISLFGKLATGQAVTGTLLGTVVDPTGAVVPNANVTLTNEGTAVINKTTSGQQGFYTFPNLNPGQYSVTVESAGFRTEISRHNVVLVEQSTRVDLTLSPGTVSQQVTVTGSTPLVETTTSDLGTTIDSTQISNLPVNGRSPQMLMQLAPGSTPTAWGAGNGEDSSTAATTAPGGGGGGAYTATNGFPFESNLYLVDGVSDFELENGYMGLQIPFDFVGEMKLETSDPTAEYGTFGAQVSNITTKSGTNRFHGQLFEYNRNTDFNSTDYFSTVNPPFHYNMFGGEVDGPIIRDKLFFSGDLQWLKLATGSSGVQSSPTAAARSGNLSAFDSNGTGPITNAMACYYSAKANGAANPLPCTASSAITKPGYYDTVPASDISPIAAAFLNPSVWPLPNLSGAVSNATQILVNDASMPQEDARVDWALSQNDRFFGRFGYSIRHQTQPLYFGADANPNPFMNGGNGENTNQLSNNVLGWDHTFGRNGTMINELRLGYSRYATSDFTAAFAQYPNENNTLGVPNGNIAAYPDTSGIAQVNIDSNAFEGTGDSGWLPQTVGRISNVYQFNDAFALVHGRHNLKFGIAINPIQARVFNAQNDPRGQFVAAGNYTGAGSAGSGLADFLVGALNSVARDHFFDKPNTRTNEFGEFAQDDFRLSSKITLNLGIRYDVYTHPVDTKNLQSNFVLTGTNAGEIQIGSSGNRGPNVNTYFGNLAPRFGVAYTPDGGKTAYRAAFGVSYFNGNFGADGGTLERNFPELEQENNNAPQSNCTSLYTGAGVYTGSGTAEYSQCGSFIMANGLPPGSAGSGSPYTPLVPVSTSPGGFIFSPVGFGVYDVASNFRQSRADNWNVSIERQVGENMTIHAAYVGTTGAYLYNDWQLNQCNPTTFTSGPTAAQLGITFPQCEPYYSFASNPNWTTADNGSVSTVDFRNSGANSHYNAGELVFERRAGSNLTFTGGYTWSKLMDNDSNQLDSYDMHQYLDTAGWHHANYPQTLTLTYVYALPFGRGQKFANSISPVEDAIVGGWTISGVTWFRSEPPLLITASAGGLLSQNSGQRANYTCSVADNPHQHNNTPGSNPVYWLDTGCWAAPTGFVFGNAGVGEGNAYGPRYQSWDMSFAKAIHLTEGSQLQFQAQFFNIFNHVNLQAPDTNASDGVGKFGVITSDYLPRQGQLGMVFSF